MDIERRQNQKRVGPHTNAPPQYHKIIQSLPRRRTAAYTHHHLFIAVISIHPIRQHKPTPKIYVQALTSNPADTDRYINALKYKFDTLNDLPDDPELAWITVSGIICEAAEETIGHRTVTGGTVVNHGFQTRPWTSWKQRQNPDYMVILQKENA